MHPDLPFFVQVEYQLGIGISKHRKQVTKDYRNCVHDKHDLLV